jgi:hypothetical protein
MKFYWVPADYKTVLREAFPRQDFHSTNDQQRNGQQFHIPFKNPAEKKEKARTYTTPLAPMVQV